MQVNHQDTLLTYQGDKVITKVRNKDGSTAEYVLTLIHAVKDNGVRQMRMVNRANKKGRTTTPDWPMSQELFDTLEPAAANEHGAKWQLKIKL